MTKRRDALKDYLTPITSRFSAENPLPKQRPQVASGALQSMNDAISGLSLEANELRKALADGLTIVKLDPGDIDASFVRDRLDDFAGDEFQALVASIRENGQVVPVLVRPHPESGSRYQLAFGHRRVAALGQLGQKVKAFVRELSDEELVIAQGNENLERKDLSFIEKSLFALRLEERGMSRSVIMSTFGTSSKGVLSEMIALARKLPPDLIEAVGPAPGIGRPRWDAMADRIGISGAEVWKSVLASADFEMLASADRFEAVYSALKDKKDRSNGIIQLGTWVPKDKSASVSCSGTSRKASITVKANHGLEFAQFITGQLDDLYEAFQQSQKASTGE